MRRLLLFFFIVCSTPVDGKVKEESPKLLSWSEQIEVREHWLPKRYEMLLAMIASTESVCGSS